MNELFGGCNKLKKIDLSNFIIGESTDCSDMFIYVNTTSGIRINTNQDTADKIKTANTGLTDLNFEIIE